MDVMSPKIRLSGGRGKGVGREPREEASPSRRWPWLLVAVLAALVLAYAFVAEPMRVSSSSMRPTLLPSDQVLVDKVTYRLREPRRGELVVFHPPVGGGLALKRVVALPADRVGVRDGVLFVNGRPVREAYVDYESVDGTFFGPVTVPDGRIFVLGDRRANSEDSRAYGSVPEDDVLGQAAFVMWPPGRAGVP
jgi:signal peptidase I